MRKRCKHPYEESDTFSVVHNFTNQNITALNKCDYIDNVNQTITCKEWVFDKTYYQDTLTEEVKQIFCNQMNFK